MGNPIFYSQGDFENLARNLRLNDKQKELLASSLKHRNLVAPDFLVTKGRKRALTQEFDEMYKTDEETGITYCWDINELFTRINHPHKPEEWRLFIDGSSESLKAVLLHITNVHPSIPVAYATKLKETSKNIGNILKLIEHAKHKWLICADLKVVGILQGLVPGYARHQCFICLWEGRKDALHYDYTHKWPLRINFKAGQRALSQLETPLVDEELIILPPLHIKLGLVRNFIIKLIRTNQEAHQFLVKFMNNLGVSTAKVNNGEKKKKIKNSVINVKLNWFLEFSDTFHYFYYF